VVEGSDDGVAWRDLVESDTHTAEVNVHPWLRVRTVTPSGVRSQPSDTYAGGGGTRWLIVDGYDRVLTGSWRQPTHQFVARVALALGQPTSSASNEAVAAGMVSLTDFDRVVWLLGDESTSNVTFNANERAAIDAFLAADGELIVSGSEVGFATPSDWLQGSLHTQYVSDNANTNGVEGYTLGVVYPEDFPDVLSGSDVVLSYDTGGAAAVGWQEALVVIGFAIETLDDSDLASMLAHVRAYLDGAAP